MINRDFIFITDRPALEGDIVLFINENYRGCTFTPDKIYRVRHDQHKDATIEIEVDDEGDENGMVASSFRIIKTAPGYQARVGDTITPIKYTSRGRTRGSMYNAIEIYGNDEIKYDTGVSADMSCWLVLCTVNHTNNTTKAYEL